MKIVSELSVVESRPPKCVKLAFAVSSLLLYAAVNGRDVQDGQHEEPEDYVRWDSAYIQDVADRLEKQLGDKALVWETVGNYDGHSMYLVLRGRTSPAEVHDTESDIQIGVRGTALSIVGGELVDPESLPRKQQRGTSIDGGLRQKTCPGDMIHIPPGIPHQLIVDQPYMYLLFKLDEEPLG